MTILLLFVYSFSSIGATVKAHLCAGKVQKCVCGKASKNKSSKNNNLNKLIIYYGDYTFKNSALDMVSLLKNEIKNLNPTVIQVNKKFRVKVATINDINEFDIFLTK